MMAEPAAPAPAAAADPAPPAVEEYAHRQLTRLAKSARELRRGDPDAVHDARVASRRLDAALDVLLARGESGPRAGESRVLRRLRRRLGPLREREVIAQALRGLLEKTALPSREAGERLLGRLAKRIARGRRRSIRRIQARHREILALRASAELRSVLDSDAMARDAFRWVSDRRTAAHRLLGVALRSRDRDDLHQARLAVKKWRYSLEVLAEATGQDAKQESERLIALQRSLGALHDGDVLLDYLRRWSRRWRRGGHAELARALTPLLRRLGTARRRELTRLDRVAVSEPPSLSPQSSGS